MFFGLSPRVPDTDFPSDSIVPSSLQVSSHFSSTLLLWSLEDQNVFRAYLPWLEDVARIYLTPAFCRKFPVQNWPWPLIANPWLPTLPLYEWPWPSRPPLPPKFALCDAPPTVFLFPKAIEIQHSQQRPLQHHPLPIILSNSQQPPH